MHHCSRRALLGVFAILATWPAAAAAQQNRRDTDFLSRIDTTLAFDRRGTVTLSLGSGEIIVTAWNRDQIRVRARSERSVIRMDVSPTRLALDLSRPRGGDTRFEVTVPVAARVIARATNGDISITGAKGGVEAQTQSGDLTVDDVGETLDLGTMSGDITARGVTGTVDINTLNGDVTLTDVRGDVEATSVSGDIDLRGVIAKYVRAKSTSGDISYDGAIDGAGRYEIGSHSGSVYLVLPQTTGALLTIATYSGAIESDFLITLKPGEHGTRRFTFEIGKGDARISAESFSGDITIRSKGRGGGPSDQ